MVPRRRGMPISRQNGAFVPVPQPDWTQEGAHPVSPGVHRIPLPLPGDGLRAVNVYAIEAAGGLVLIDSGWALAAARSQLERSLAALGAGLGDVRRFLVTHLHRDHYTQALAIREALGTPVALGAEERHSLDAVLRHGYRGMSAQLRLLRAAGATRLADEMADAVARFRRQGGDGEGSGPFADPDEWITTGQRFDLGTRVPRSKRCPVVIHSSGSANGPLPSPSPPWRRKRATASAISSARRVAPAARSSLSCALIPRYPWRSTASRECRSSAPRATGVPRASRIASAWV